MDWILKLEPWKILLSKLITSLGIHISGLILTKILWILISRFGMSNIVIFRHTTTFLEYIIFIIILFIIIMFSYILSKSCSFMRNKARLTTALLTIVIPMILLSILSIFFVAIGAFNISVSHYGEFFVSSNSKLSWLETLCAIAISVIMITICFLSSCALFKRKFECY